MALSLTFTLSACGTSGNSAETTSGSKSSVSETIEAVEPEEEILEGVHHEITVSADNVEDYNTIFVGYPNWLAYHNLIQCTQA